MDGCWAIFIFIARPLGMLLSASMCNCLRLARCPANAGAEKLLMNIACFFEHNRLLWRLSCLREGTNTAKGPVVVVPTALESASISAKPEICPIPACNIAHLQ